MTCTRSQDPSILTPKPSLNHYIGYSRKPTQNILFHLTVHFYYILLSITGFQELCQVIPELYFKILPED